MCFPLTSPYHGYRSLTANAAKSTTRARQVPLLIARASGRVYDRSVVRKCASFAFGLLLLVVLGFAISHAYALKVPSLSAGLSTPCQPAPPAFAGESKVVSTIDSIFVAQSVNARAGLVRGPHVEAVSRAIPSRAPGTCRPLLYRPPPANS